MPPSFFVKFCGPLVKVTVAPAPMLSEASVWLTLPNFNAAPPLTCTLAPPLPRLPFTFVVPPLAVSVP